MAFTGYLKIDDIKGESKRAEHEDEIDVFGVNWGMSQTSSAATGSGRTRGRAVIQDFVVNKYYDAASPYLALACMQGKSFPTMTLNVRKDSGEAHLDYLCVEMENVIISSYQMSAIAPLDTDNDMIIENVSLSCEKFKVKYTVQADDHSAGDEHEIEYDAVAGK